MPRSQRSASHQLEVSKLLTDAKAMVTAAVQASKNPTGDHVVHGWQKGNKAVMVTVENMNDASRPVIGLQFAPKSDRVRVGRYSFETSRFIGKPLGMPVNSISPQTLGL